MTEHTVHDEGDADHVAAVFQDRQKQKQDRHLRNKSKHCANTADDAINDQRLYQISGSDGSQEPTDRILDHDDELIVGPVGDDRTDRRDRNIVHDKHDGNEDRNA